MTDKDKIQIGMIGSLVLVLLVMTVRMFQKIKPKTPRPTAAPAVQPKVPSSAAPSKPTAAKGNLFGRLNKESEGLIWERDPFGEKKIIVTKGPFLSGISLDPLFAIVNDQVLTVGETVDGQKIVAIEADRVVLSDGTQERVLTIEISE